MEIEKQDNNLAEVNYQIITDESIEELAKRYISLEIIDPGSYRIVKSALNDIRSYRIAVEKKRKELKKDALEYGRKVDGEAKRITGRLEPIETKLSEKKQAADDITRKNEEEVIRIEEARIRAIRFKISDIQKLAIGLHVLTAEQIGERIMQAEAVEIRHSEFAELTREAKEAKAETVQVIKEAFDIQKKLEADQIAREAEDARLEKVRAEQKVQADQLAIQRAEIETANEEIRKARQAIADEKQAEIDRKEREAFEKKLAVEAKIEAEEHAKALIKRAEEERIARVEAERIAIIAEKREARRRKELRPDKEKLLSFAKGLLDYPRVDGVKSGKMNALMAGAISEIRTIGEEMVAQIERM